MKTKFIKVSVEERLPEFGQRVIALVLEQNDLGLSKYLWNVEFDDIIDQFKLDGNIVQVEYWLDEVPDKEEEMMDMLEECKNQLEYLNSKFPATGTTNNILSRLTQLLNK